MNTTQKSISIVLSSLLIAVLIFLLAPGKRADATLMVATAEGQVAQVSAWLGYNPGFLKGKAGVPTTLQLETKDTYDCSVDFRIPKLGIAKMLPETGTTTFTIPPQPAGTTLNGTCGMGMYHFSLAFE